MTIAFEDDDDDVVPMVELVETDPDDIDGLEDPDESSSVVPTTTVSEFQKSLVESEDEADDLPIPALAIVPVAVTKAAQPSEENFEYAVIGVSEIELGKEEDIEINAIDPAGDIGEDPDTTTEEED